ncbi:MAG: SDR family oxidoreductase [Caldilineaceae bacterium]|nr:SDR family oxidoreductase [Caldilineaceae bacterium]
MNKGPATVATFLESLFALTGKTALITGATGGIGEALALAFAQAGATVGVSGRDRQKIEDTCRAITAIGGQAVALPADVTTVAACRQLVADAQAALGRLDILINCAGMNRRKPVTAVSEEDWETIMAVNLRSAYFLCQAAHPIMQAQGGGKIINIGSLNTTYGLDGVSVYGATKAGMAQMTRVMAVEWAADQIQVNLISPGFMMTPLTQAGLWNNEQRSRWIHSRLPLRRPGNPAELVGAALLLASPASSYMTGSTITVDGGFLAGGSWDRDEAWRAEE